jgi:pimeloyl-ACP methyl ester carboxylesterase
MHVRQDSGARDAPAVIFIHGAGLSGWMWKKQVEALGRIRSIVVDLPDHGEDRERPFTSIEAAADEIAQLASELAPSGKAHLVGHSLGAKIALEALSRHPESVASAVVSSALVRPYPLARLMNSRFINSLSIKMLRSERIARAQAAQFEFPDEEMVDAYLADMAALEEGNLERPMSAFCSRLCPPPGLEGVRCPVLVTAGSREAIAMRESVTDLEGLIPGAKATLISGARHNYPWAQYGAYNRVLEAWFRIVL